VNLSYNDSLTSDSISAGGGMLCLADTAEAYEEHLYFATDSFIPFHDRPAYREDGVSGTPLPYALRNDNILSLTLMISSLLFIVVLAKSFPLFVKQTKDFFRLQHSDDDLYPVYSRFSLFMLAFDCLMLAVLCYIIVCKLINEEFIIIHQPLVVVLFFGAFLVYFLLKGFIYSVVNKTFWGRKKSLQWIYSCFYLIAIEGMMLFPVVLLLFFFDLSIKNATFCFGFVLILNKLLTFYKCWNIFFRQNIRSLQIFLYFCALEAAPLLAFAGLWLALVYYSKVIF